MAKNELRTAIQILQEKKKRNQSKLKQNPHMRKATAKLAKDKRRALHTERQMKYGARTKAKMLIFEGPSKGWIGGNNKKDKKRRQGKPRFGTI